MKLRVKTLKGKQFVLEVPDDSDVAATKAAIAESQGFEVGKLIHSGKVLKDDSATLESCKVKDNDFLVVMISKKKYVKAGAAAATPAAAPAAASAPATPAAASAPASASATTTPAATAASTPVAPPAPRMPAIEGLEDKLSMAEAMGFDRNEAHRALALAYGNMERAIQYLSEGIPEGMSTALPAASPAPAPAPAAATPAAATSPAATAATSGSDPLAPLRSHPQLNALRALVQANPSSLPTVLQQIGTASPGLLTLINNNMEAFLAMLNEPVGTTAGATPAATAAATPATTGGMPAGMNAAAMLGQLRTMTPEQRTQLAAAIGVTPEQLSQVAEAAARMPPEMLAAAASGGAPPPGATVIRLTTEEKASVDRLMALGFTQRQAVEAYLSCDKDESLAANLLFQNRDDF